MSSLITTEVTNDTIKATRMARLYDIKTAQLASQQPVIKRYENEVYRKAEDIYKELKNTKAGEMKIPVKIYEDRLQKLKNTVSIMNIPKRINNWFVYNNRFGDLIYKARYLPYTLMSTIPINCLLYTNELNVLYMISFTLFTSLMTYFLTSNERVKLETPEVRTGAIPTKYFTEHPANNDGLSRLLQKNVDDIQNNHIDLGKNKNGYNDVEETTSLIDGDSDDSYCDSD